MQHSTTIAIARGVLAEGRTLDAARMIEPLLERNGHSAGLDGGQILLRCLLARVRLLRSGEASQVLELLEPYEKSEVRQSLETSVRAEVALWLGWARAWQDDDLYDGARALNLLGEAEHAFRAEMNPTGRCWTMIGKAHAYFSMDEHELMLQALEEATALQEKLGDVSADMWIQHLAISGARFEGRFRDALAHVASLEALAAKHSDDLSLGRARSQRALLLYELGRNPAQVVEAAVEAENLLLGAYTKPGYSLLSAYHTHIGALIRLGEWDAADRLIDHALSMVGKLGPSPGYISLQRARLLLYRGDLDRASDVL
ncbi:MAG: AAA family ATPase, partial [Rhodothermales bacterium]